MGLLIDYLNGLRYREVIDKDITLMIKDFFPPQAKAKDWISTGVTNMKYHFLYIPWVPAAIAYFEIDVEQDLLSLPFSGCYMALYDNESNNPHGFHIHTNTNADSRKNTWNSYIHNCQDTNRCIIYKPNTEYLYAAKSRYPEKAFQLWGIISAERECFSVIVESYNNNFIFYSINGESRCSSTTIP